MRKKGKWRYKNGRPEVVEISVFHKHSFGVFFSSKELKLLMKRWKNMKLMKEDCFLCKCQANIFLWDVLEMEILQSTLILRPRHLWVGSVGFWSLICEVFGVHGCVSVKWFLLDWGLDIMSLKKKKLSEISVLCKWNRINVSRYRLSKMVLGKYLVQHLFPLAQMKIGLVCRKLLSRPTMGQPLYYFLYCYCNWTAVPLKPQIL